MSSVITAFEAYRQAGGQNELVLVGAKGWKQKNTSSEQVNDAINVLGHVSDDELMMLYRFSEALIFPSLYEGFGLPALEAMQFGVPVLASNRGALPEIVGDGGILVDPLSIDEISQAMLDLSTDKKLRSKLSQCALRQASKFSWQRAAEETMRSFRTIVTP